RPRLSPARRRAQRPFGGAIPPRHRHAAAGGDSAALLAQPRGAQQPRRRLPRPVARPLHSRNALMEIRACLFDVFGTVVDWRTSVSRDLAAFAKERGIGGVDWLEFAVEWRKLYQPSMDEVRSGRRPFTILDVLHRESLDKLIARYRIQ